MVSATVALLAVRVSITTEPVTSRPLRPAGRRRRLVGAALDALGDDHVRGRELPDGDAADPGRCRLGAPQQVEGRLDQLLVGAGTRVPEGLLGRFREGVLVGHVVVEPLLELGLLAPE